MSKLAYVTATILFCDGLLSRFFRGYNGRRFA